MNDESFSKEGKAAVVRTKGDLVAVTLPALRARLRELVVSGTLHLTLDLAGTAIVDSAGIGLLIAAHNSLKKAGGELKLVHVSAEILELFQTMRMHQHFSVSGNCNAGN